MSSCILRSWEFDRAYWLYCLANHNNDNDVRIAFHKKWNLIVYIMSFIAFVSRLGPLAARLRQNQVPVFTLMLQALRNFFIVFPIFIAAAYMFLVLSCLSIRSVTIFTSRRTTGILSDFAIRASSCPISHFSRHRCARCLPTGLHVSLSSVFLLLGTSADSSI